MKKYLAVIHDSFREAFASRVLWLVLIVITLFLLAIAPLGFREEVTWRLGDSDVRTWPDFMERLREEGPEGKSPISKHIWNLLDPELRARLVKLKIPGKDPDVVNPWDFINTLSSFQKAMNKLLERPDFYQAEAWKGVQFLSRELIELREEKVAQLSEKERLRYHRLLLEAAYPNLVRSSPPTSIQLTYAWRDLGPAQPLRGATFQEALQTAAAWVMKWFVGAVGVFVAVLVTAPIIPQMFDPGSLHLLLSKPVKRSLLFLAKFVGGCAFIFIGAAYLIGGIWLILGARFGVWDSTLLVSIPLYLFVFAIYYSVSALSGVIWRSPVVSIALTILFFVTCWTVGTAKVAFERAVWDKMRITQVVAAKDSLITVNELGMVNEWDDAKREWREIFASDAQNQMRGLMMIMPVVPHEFRPVGPIYDRVGDRLLSGQPSFPPGKLQLCVGLRDKKWESEPGVSMPVRTFALLTEPDGGILVASDLDLKRLVGDPLRKAEAVKVFGMALPMLSSGPFRSVGPEPALVLTQPAAAAVNSVSGELALYTRGAISVLRRTSSGRYQQRRQAILKGAERQPIVLCFQGDRLLLGREDGRIQVLDATTLKPLIQFRPEGRNSPRFITALPDGSLFAIVFHTGQLWLYDTVTNEVRKAGVAGQGQISAAAFTPDGKLLVADQTTRISQYRPNSLALALEKRYTPDLGLLVNSYRYGLLPFYTIFPKPGELNTTFEYLLSGRETKETEGDDLAAAQRQIDPWTPLWSSAAFTLVMLLLACLYIERQDF